MLPMIASLVTPRVMSAKLLHSTCGIGPVMFVDRLRELRICLPRSWLIAKYPKSLMTTLQSFPRRRCWYVPFTTAARASNACIHSRMHACRLLTRIPIQSQPTPPPFDRSGPRPITFSSPSLPLISRSSHRQSASRCDIIFVVFR